MKIIRNKVFETNSSSCHALVVPNSSENLEEPEELHLAYNGEYGWGPEVLTSQRDKFTYLGILAAEIQQQDVVKEIDNYFETLESLGFTIGDFDDDKESMKKKLLESYDYYIDHGNEGVSIYKELIENTDKLKRFILSPKSFITIGNDNDYGDIFEKPNEMFNLGLEFTESEWGSRSCNNINELEKDYDIYYKGN